MNKATEALHHVMPTIRKAGRVTEAIVVISILFGSGCVAGYWISNNHWVDARVELKREHLAEIGRLTEAYGTRLTKLADKTEVAVDTAATAAATATEASATAETAAKTAQTAAAQSNVAARTAKTALSAASTVPEPTRAQINRSVDAANRKANNK